MKTWAQHFYEINFCLELGPCSCIMYLRIFTVKGCNMDLCLFWTDFVFSSPVIGPIVRIEPLSIFKCVAIIRFLFRKLCENTLPPNDKSALYRSGPWGWITESADLSILSIFVEYPSSCTPEAYEEDIDYFQIIDGTNKALELIDDNLVFSVNEKKETQFWYFHLANPGDEYGLILGKNSQRAFDIFTSTDCENDICKVGTWNIHNGDNQLWKKVGDDLISKWNVDVSLNLIFHQKIYVSLVKYRLEFTYLPTFIHHCIHSCCYQNKCIKADLVLTPVRTHSISGLKSWVMKLTFLA